MMKSRLALLAIGTASLVAGACGGGGDGLAHRFPEPNLAPVPPSEQVGVADALRDVYLAERGRDHTAYRLRQVQTEIRVAKNDRKRAELDRDSAALRRKSAEQAADQGNAEASRKDESNAAATKEGLSRKIDYLLAQREYLKEQLKFTAKDIRAKQARYELTKAEVAKTRSIQPKGFQLARYQNQHKDRQARAAQSQRAAVGKKQRADALEKAWRNSGKKAAPVKTSAR